MRDFIRDESYFIEFINETQQCIDISLNALKNKTVPSENIFTSEMHMNYNKFRMIMGKYSYGEDLKKLKYEYLDLIKDYPKYWCQGSSYVHVLWILSLGVLFNINKDEFKIMYDTAVSNDYNDALVSFLGCYVLDNKIIELQDNFIMDKPYHELKEIVNDANERDIKLKTYLEKDWYKAHKSQDWYDNHKFKWNSYFGYWSFEAGAIAKILGIDDNYLIDTKYYPYDLVHFKG